MKNDQQPISGNSNQLLRQKPCTGNIAFGTGGGGGSMIEFAFVIAASMRIMADTDETYRLPQQPSNKEARPVACFA